MLIPQYSLRWLLGATTVCAVICSIFAVALRGSLLAAAVSMAIVALAVAAMFYVLLFTLVWVVSLMLPQRSSTAGKKADAKPKHTLLLALALAVVPATSGASGAMVRTVVAKGPAAWSVAGAAAQTVVGNGLKMDIGFETVAARPGYRPVRISVLPTAPVTADRTLSIEILLRRSWNEGYDLRVVRELEIPAGSGRVTTTIPVPAMAGSDQYAVNVSEDRVLHKALSVRWKSYSADWSEACPAVLFMGKGLPDTSRLAAIFPAWHGWGVAPGPVYSPGTGTTPGQQLSTAEIWSMETFPDQWINYTGFDIVCLSREQFATLRQARPGAFRALVAWTAAGGNLWVYGLGSNWRHMPELEELLGLPAEPGQPGRSAPAGWTAPENSLYGRKPETTALADDGSSGNVTIARQRANVVVNGSAPQPAAAPPGWTPYAAAGAAKTKPYPKSPTPRPTPPRRPPFVFRPFQAGLVVAMAADQPFPETEIAWRWVLDSMGEGRWQWYQRHGLSLKRKNPDFWNFLIPGVGMAPVTTFCVLISVFVIAIGPVNYWLLLRRRQLHLLLLTIPASATVVTLVLFGYAVMADGLDVRVRARSVTHLDQHSGRAVCWTRLSYFAGLSPRGGLRFPGDTAVFPLEQSPGALGRRGTLARELAWDEDQQLASGWLASRTPTQFVTLRCRPSSCGLDLLDPAGKERAPSVRNRLQTAIQHLVVRTKDGTYYQAASVAVGATVKLEPISSIADARLMKRIHDDKLVAPPGMAGADPGGLFGGGFMWFMNQESLSDPEDATSRLEQMRPRSETPPRELPPGSYAALVDRSPEVVLGVPSPREEPSSHVILGQW